MAIYRQKLFYYSIFATFSREGVLRRSAERGSNPLDYISGAIKVKNHFTGFSCHLSDRSSCVIRSHSRSIK